LQGNALSPFVSSELLALVQNPMKFNSPGGLAHGYPATILADICDVVLNARKAAKLQAQQMHIADRCERWCVGLRASGSSHLLTRRRAFSAIARGMRSPVFFEAFIAKELQPYLRTSPADFYQEMFRLRGMDYPTDTVQRPLYFGLLT
jgi:hypothetical protein